MIADSRIPVVGRLVRNGDRSQIDPRAELALFGTFVFVERSVADHPARKAPGGTLRYCADGKRRSIRARQHPDAPAALDGGARIDARLLGSDDPMDAGFTAHEIVSLRASTWNWTRQP